MKPSKGRNPKRQGLRLVEVTQEEQAQMARLEEHPWEQTLRNFLARVCSDRGYTLCEMEVLDPGGNLVKLPYLRHPDGRAIHLTGNVGMDDVLDEFVTASLCRRIGVPPEDFGLRPEEPYDDDFDDWEV